MYKIILSFQNEVHKFIIATYPDKHLQMLRRQSIKTKLPWDFRGMWPTHTWTTLYQISCRAAAPSPIYPAWELVYLWCERSQQWGKWEKWEEWEKAHCLMPNNQIKTNRAEVTATVPVACSLPLCRLLLRPGLGCWPQQVAASWWPVARSENGFKLPPDCLLSWLTLVAFATGHGPAFSRPLLNPLRPHLFLSTVTALCCPSCHCRVKFNQAHKFLHVRSISISMIFNGRLRLLVTCVGYPVRVSHTPFHLPLSLYFALYLSVRQCEWACNELSPWDGRATVAKDFDPFVDDGTMSGCGNGNGQKSEQ